MLTTRQTVDFPYTRQELEALFRYANAHDVEQGGCSAPLLSSGWQLSPVAEVIVPFKLPGRLVAQG